MKHIAILGHFGGNQVFLDGQTVKTKILFDELKNNTDWDIKIIDTYLKSKRPIKLFIQTLNILIKRERIIVLLSGNGMKFFFPLLSVFAKHWKVNIYHDVIGGNLDNYVSNNPKFIKYLNSFKVNWVETETLKAKLVDLGIKNCEVIPNFKRLNIIGSDNNSQLQDEPYKFCTFSRVMKEKGIEDAIKAIEDINYKYGRMRCTLDIYGIIEDSYNEKFATVMSKCSDAIKYQGRVPYNESVSILKDYYALLFPTFWVGEGFPGTIIDAFSAGLPVIATDWNSNKEIIKNGVNGIIYPSELADTLIDSILCIISDSDTYIEMKNNCIISANAYKPDKYISHMIKRIESDSII